MAVDERLKGPLVALILIILTAPLFSMIVAPTDLNMEPGRAGDTECKRALPLTRSDPDEPGSYPVGTYKDQTFQDREDNTVRVDVYYPSQSGGEASPVHTDKPFPLVVFGRGFATSEDDYIWFGEHMASWGYVAVIVHFPGGMMPDHETNANDITDTIDWAETVNGDDTHLLYGAVDDDKVGTAGFSMGARAIILASARDPRIDAFCALAPANISMGPGSSPDPQLYEEASNITIPGMVQKGTKDGIAPPAPWLVYQTLAGIPKVWIGIVGGNHNQFTDTVGNIGDNSPDISREEQHRIARKYATLLFQFYLKRDPGYYDLLFGSGLDSDENAGEIQAETDYMHYWLTLEIQGYSDPAYASSTFVADVRVNYDDGNAASGITVEVEFLDTAYNSSNVTDAQGFSQVSCSTPPAVGDYEVEITATWGGYTATEVMDVTLVSPPNDPPEVVWQPPDLEMEEDGRIDHAFSLLDVFQDPQGETLDFSVDTIDEVEVDIAVNGSVSLYPEENWNGHANLEFTASDPMYQTAVVNVGLDVIGVNDPPKVKNTIPAQSMPEDTEKTVDFNGVFHDPDIVYGDKLTYSTCSGDNVTCELHESFLRVKLIPRKDWWGSQLITLSAEDTEGETASTSFQLEVENVNDPPVANKSSLDIVMDEDSEHTLDLLPLFTDIDDESLEYSVRGNEELDILFGKESLSIYPPSDWYGSESFYIEASDGSESAEIKVDVIVAPVNDPPIIIYDGKDELKLTQGESHMFEIVAEDVEDDPLTYEWLLNGSKEDTTSKGEWTFTPRSEHVGELELTVRVSDGQAQAEFTWALEVEAKADDGGDGDDGNGGDGDDGGEEDGIDGDEEGMDGGEGEDASGALDVNVFVAVLIIIIVIIGVAVFLVMQKITGGKGGKGGKEGGKSDKGSVYEPEVYAPSSPSDTGEAYRQPPGPR